MVMGTGVTFL